MKSQAPPLRPGAISIATRWWCPNKPKASSMGSRKGQRTVPRTTMLESLDKFSQVHRFYPGRRGGTAGQAARAELSPSNRHSRGSISLGGGKRSDMHAAVLPGSGIKFKHFLPVLTPLNHIDVATGFRRHRNW